MILRGYQERAISDIRERFRSGDRRVLYTLPTGGGKTVIFSEAARLAASLGGRTLVLAHRVELVAQAARAFRAAGLRVGTIGASLRNERTAPDDNARIAMVQTLVRRGDALGAWRPTLVVIDECHRSTAETYRKIIAETGGACVLGVTATPERTDGAPLGDVFESLVRGPTMRQLQADGHLVPIRTYSVPGADLSGARLSRGDFVAADVASAMDRPKLVGSVVDHYQRLADRRRGIVYASSVAHACKLAEAFRAAGVASAVVTGETDKDERRRMFDRLGSGDIRVLCNYAVAIEGIDVPQVSYVGLARATASLVVYLQAIGRGSRPSAGKSDLVVCDHAGNAAERFGLPEQDRAWTLATSSRGPGGARPEVLAISTCEECLAAWSRAEDGNACPRCGHEPEQQRRRPLRVVDGQLVRITEAMRVEDRRERLKAIPARPAPHWADHAIWQRCEAKRVREGYELGWTFGLVKRLMSRGRVWR